MDHKLEERLAVYADRLAALENGSRRHVKLCGPRGWTAIVLSSLGILLLSIIGFFVSRIYSEQDFQNRTIIASEKERTVISGEIASNKKDIDLLYRRQEDIANRIRILEDWRLTTEVREEQQQRK